MIRSAGKDRQVDEYPFVIEDLISEGEQVDGMLTGLSPEQWQLATPAPGWTIAHQVAHLASIFSLAGLAASDGAGFRDLTSHLSDDFDANVAMALGLYLNNPPDALLRSWRSERNRAEEALAACRPDQPVPWLVRPLPPAVLAAAGMMELFGHGQDIADTLGIRPERTDRIRRLAEFAVRVWDFGYLARGLAVPDVQFRYELTAPSGAQWELGPADAEQSITGPAVDFCLLVTRRRHRDDLALTAAGPEADRWLDIAQAYRGTAGAGRQPGQFASLAVA
jgi:enediyne biosynthesis protein E11